MGRRSELLKLPVSVRCEVDDRLRKAAYGDYVAITAWLTRNGYAVSKSAVHRYGLALRQVDAGRGDQEALVAQVSRENGCTAAAIRDGLLLELGRLRYRESQILVKISQLDSGKAQ